MALTKCRECNSTLSTEAERCPHCGAKNKKPGTRWGLIFVLLVLVGGTMSALRDANDKMRQTAEPAQLSKAEPETSAKPSPQSEREGALLCRMAIEKGLHDPDSAQLPATHDMAIARDKPGLLHVSFSGRAKNSFGALTLHTFECLLSMNDTTGQWAILAAAEKKPGKTARR